MLLLMNWFQYLRKLPTIKLKGIMINQNQRELTQDQVITI